MRTPRSWLLLLLAVGLVGLCPGPPARAEEEPAADAAEGAADEPEPLSDEEAKRLEKLLTSAAKRRKQEEVLPALDEVGDRSHPSFQKPLLKMLTHELTRVAERAADLLARQKSETERDAAKLGKSIWKKGFSDRKNNRRPTVQGRVVYATAAVEGGAELDAARFREVERLWRAVVGDPQEANAGAIIAVCDYVRLTKDKRLCRLLAEEIDEPGTTAVNSPTNPPAGVVGAPLEDVEAVQGGRRGEPRGTHRRELQGHGIRQGVVRGEREGVRLPLVARLPPRPPGRMYCRPRGRWGREQPRPCYNDLIPAPQQPRRGAGTQPDGVAMSRLQSCHGCGAQFDVSSFAPGQQFSCGSCGTVLTAGAGAPPARTPAGVPPGPRSPGARPARGRRRPLRRSQRHGPRAGAAGTRQAGRGPQYRPPERHAEGGWRAGAATRSRRPGARAARGAARPGPQGTTAAAGAADQPCARLRRRRAPRGDRAGLPVRRRRRRRRQGRREREYRERERERGHRRERRYDAREGARHRRVAQGRGPRDGPEAARRLPRTWRSAS